MDVRNLGDDEGGEREKARRRSCTIDVGGLSAS